MASREAERRCGAFRQGEGAVSKRLIERTGLRDATAATDVLKFGTLRIGRAPGAILATIVAEIASTNGVMRTDSRAECWPLIPAAIGGIACRGVAPRCVMHARNPAVLGVNRVADWRESAEVRRRVRFAETHSNSNVVREFCADNVDDRKGT